MHTILKNLLLIFLTFCFTNLTAQQISYEVLEFNKADGLPNRSVTDIVQDNQGFIWINIRAGGISRFDGERFKTFSPKELGIRNGSSCNLAVDENNNIWFVERGPHISKGSGIIHSTIDSIYKIKDYTNGVLDSEDIAYLNKSNIDSKQWFIATRNGVIYQYDGQLKIIHRLEANKEYNAINAIKCETDGLGNYWIFNQNEILYKNASGEIVKYVIPEGSVAIKVVQWSPSIIIESIHIETTKYDYWEIDDETIRPYLKAKKIRSLSGLKKLKSGHVTYVKDNTLFIENETGDEIFQYKRLRRKGKFNQQIFALDVFEDKQGIIWMGLMNGLLKITPRKSLFTSNILEKVTCGIYKENDQLWIGSSQGSTLIDLTEKSANVNFMSTGDQNFSKIAPTLFLKDHQNRLWAGSMQRRLFELSEDGFIKKAYKLEPRSILVPFQNKATKRIWLGTVDGLFYFDESTQQAVRLELPKENQEVAIKQIYQNKKGIWIVSSAGIFHMDAKSEIITKQYNLNDGIPIFDFNWMYEDKEGYFWLASQGNGLIKWDLEKKQFEQFTKENGLSNNVLYAVYEDDFGNLWLPSDYGLMCFDKTTLEVQTFLPQHGVPHEEFNTFSHFQDEDGTLFFGGLDGVISFHPRDIQNQVINPPPLYITNAQVINEDEQKTKSQTSEILNSNSIILNPDDEILEIELALLDYNLNDPTQFAYKIEGFDNRWIKTIDSKISILKLPHGNYTLKIKARKNSSIKYSEPLNIAIQVNPPFYFEWWFIFLVGLASAGVVVGIFKWRVWSLEKDRQRLEIEVEKRTQIIEKDRETIAAQAEELKELDKTKSRFFSYITHEFRTPLTLVISPLMQFLKEQPPPTIFRRRTLGMIKNAEHLLNLINQILDLSKLESGQMKVEASKGDIIAYTDELINRFQPLALDKQQSIHFISKEDYWMTYFDRKKWDKIIYNLLSNAMKYSETGGIIQVNLSKRKNNSIQLSVKDTGIGMTRESLKQVFKHFFQLGNSTVRESKGSGIGLALIKELVEVQNGKIEVYSEPNIGTTFRISLPVLQNQENAPLITEIIPEAFPPIIRIDKIGSSTLEEVPKERSGKLELLIIEDNPEMREYIRYCIDDSKYHITESSNGSQGLHKAEAMVPDLIISDVMMPKKDGFEVVEAIRSDLTTSHIPIILLTIKASFESRLKGLQRGADVYLTKPFSPEELRLRIEKLIEIRRLLNIRYESGIPSSKDTTFQKEDEFITELKAYITEHINSTKLSGETVGKHFGMSRVHLYRKLKALTGHSISEFVQVIRLEKAYELIKKEELNISEIAYNTGFTSPSYFTKIFKQKYGKTPSEV